MEPPIDPSLPCSQQSLSVGEPIAGSGTPDIAAWLMVEHPGRWGYDALLDSGLSEGLKTHLGAMLPKLRTRFLLIRRFGDGETRDDGKRRAYLVQPPSGSRPQSKIWHFTLGDPDELMELDLESMLLAGLPGGDPNPPEHLYLVCTHGRRDRCCALRGVALAKAMSELELDGELWQCSHLGGHRFAATMVYLPHGIHYGRLQPDDAPDLLAAHRRGEIYDLRNYRGQTRYPAAVQAAEAWLRDQESDMSLDGPEHLDHSLRGQRWSARFRTRDGALHKVVVEPRMGSIPRLKSCDAKAPEPAQWFYAVRHEAHTLA